MHLLNHSAIADHTSVTCLMSQTIHTHPLSQPPPQCPALPCHHHISLAPPKSIPSHLWRPRQAPTWSTTTFQHHISTWTSAHGVDATMQHIRAASSHCHVAEIDVAMRMTNEEHLSFPLFLVSAPIILLWILTGIPSATLPDNECGCSPTLTINDRPHPTTHHQDLGTTWRPLAHYNQQLPPIMHRPWQTRPQRQTRPQWWMWQPNGERWRLSPFTVVDMEIWQHNKRGGHHLDLSTDVVDYVVYNVVNPHVHPLWVSNPPNPVQTPTPTPEIPLPMERVWVCIG